MPDQVVLLTIPQLRRRDVTPGALASLDELAAHGAVAELIPAFPGLAASSFATLMTGTGPYEHGIIGNTYFDRSEHRVVSSPLPDSAVLVPRLWNRVRDGRPGAKTLVWLAPNARGVAVDCAAWIEPGAGLLTQPPELAAELTRRFGELPALRRKPGTEAPRLETTSWILRTAAAAIADQRPTLAVVRVPYLGQVARRYGPDGREACKAVIELEASLAPFLASLPKGTLVLAVTESVTTPVSGPVFPNRILRSLGLLALKPASGGGLDVDLSASAAFALADHQICHIYLNDPHQAAAVASAFSGARADGVDHVAPGSQRAALGLDHPRAGDVVLVASPDRWFAPAWWKTPQEVPRQPESTSGLAGATPDRLLDPAQVKGSLGAPSPNSEYHGVIVASQAHCLGPITRFTAREVAPIVLRACGVKPPAVGIKSSA
jgi:predicted AlkP superfamily pyrophosphatase or phosphodiesterase